MGWHVFTLFVWLVIAVLVWGRAQEPNVDQAPPGVSILPDYNEPFRLRATLRLALTQLPCFDVVETGRDGKTTWLNRRSVILDAAPDEAPSGISSDRLLHEIIEYGRRMREDWSVGRWPDWKQTKGGTGVNVAAAIARFDLFNISAQLPSKLSEGVWGGVSRSNGQAPDNNMPFVVRVLASHDTRVVLFGDLHGSLHSLLRVLSGLQERGWLQDDLSISPAWRDRLVIAFMGDFVDRGPYGAEVVGTLLRLHRANSGSSWSGGISDGGGGLGSVLLLRGNHEEMYVNKFMGTFEQELRDKYAHEQDLMVQGRHAAHGVLPVHALVRLCELVGQHPSEDGMACVLMGAMTRLYTALPLAAFIGVHGAEAAGRTGDAAWLGRCTAKSLSTGTCGQNATQTGSFVQASHGGIEPGFNPRSMLTHPAGKSRASGTLQTLFWPIVGLMRQSWMLERVGQPMLRRLPWRVVRSQFRNLASRGVRPRDAFTANKTMFQAALRVSRRYPVDPSASSPGLGFLWSDFYVDDSRPALGFVPMRGPVYGRDLTRHWLEDSGVGAIVRAHQHHDNSVSGPCLSRMRANGGWASHWSGEGTVTTFLSGSGIPDTAFQHEGVGVLRLQGSKPDQWRLAHCSHRVGLQQISGEDGVQIGRSAGTLARSQIDPKVAHACDAGFRLVCRALPFAGRAAAADGGLETDHIPEPAQGSTGLAQPESESDTSSPPLPALPQGLTFSRAELDRLRDSAAFVFMQMHSGAEQASESEPMRSRMPPESTHQPWAWESVVPEDKAGSTSGRSFDGSDQGVSVTVRNPVHGRLAHARTLRHSSGTSQVLRVVAEIAQRLQETPSMNMKPLASALTKSLPSPNSDDSTQTEPAEDDLEACLIVLKRRQVEDSKLTKQRGIKDGKLDHSGKELATLDDTQALTLPPVTPSGNKQLATSGEASLPDPDFAIIAPSMQGPDSAVNSLRDSSPEATRSRFSRGPESEFAWKWAGWRPEGLLRCKRVRKQDNVARTVQFRVVLSTQVETMTPVVQPRRRASSMQNTVEEVYQGQQDALLVAAKPASSPTPIPLLAGPGSSSASLALTRMTENQEALDWAAVVAVRHTEDPKLQWLAWDASVFGVDNKLTN